MAQSESQVDIAAGDEVSRSSQRLSHFLRISCLIYSARWLRVLSSLARFEFESPFI
jgi:hypothetical protein